MYFLCLFLLLFFFFVISSVVSCSFFFFFNAPSPTEIYTLSLHDALPISLGIQRAFQQHLHFAAAGLLAMQSGRDHRSEEHTSELQSRGHLVCRLLLEKKKNKKKSNVNDIII